MVFQNSLIKKGLFTVYTDHKVKLVIERGANAGKTYKKW